MKGLKSFFLLTFLAGLLAACSPMLSVPQPGNGSGGELSTGSSSEPTQEIPLPSPSPSLAPVEAASPSEDDPSVQAPTPSVDPLRFVFPTEGPEPVSHWRPPLYPVPWEPTPFDHFYFVRPIGADQVNWPLAKYRYGGVFFANEAHTGVDIPAPKGTPVLAAGSGTVIWGGYGLYDKGDPLNDPYGLAIAIKHDFGYQEQALYTIYGHMDKIFFFRGQRVETGDQIGLVGETGNVTGPHLHFEVRIGDNTFFVSRNPELWMAPPQGWGILAARMVDNDGVPLERHTLNLRSMETNQYWTVETYGKGTVNEDPYYHENLVIGDLPAGNYEVWTDYDSTVYKIILKIEPGKVTFFRLLGKRGFHLVPPPTPNPNFLPPDITPTASPTSSTSPTP